METCEFRAMNTGITLAAEGEPRRVEQGFRAAEELVRSLEQRFTRFTETSELAALNRSAGGWFDASPEMLALLELALSYHRSTGGLFNPAVLPALENAGYDRSMDDIRRNGLVASPAAPGFRFAPAPFDRIEIDRPRGAVRLPEGMRIDLGGIAKGWIAEQAARKLALYARACGVDAGGDMFLLGAPDGASGWPVFVENPFFPEEDLASLTVPSGAVATSSTVKRVWQQDGQQRHHLIDPRSGQPAQTPWASATVIAPHAAEAEVLAKAVLIAGPQGVDELMRLHPQAAFLVVDFAEQLSGSENIRRYYHHEYV